MEVVVVIVSVDQGERGIQTSDYIGTVFRRRRKLVGVDSKERQHQAAGLAAVFAKPVQAHDPLVQRQNLFLADKGTDRICHPSPARCSAALAPVKSIQAYSQGSSGSG